MSTDKELEEIKKLISSLLVSNPHKSTVLSLDREFKEQIGYSIPFRKYGFPSIDSFLRIMPDIVTVLGSGLHATLQVVVSNKVAHIDSLISKQRSSKKKRTSRGPSSRFYDNCTRHAPRPAYELPRPAYAPPSPAYKSPLPTYQPSYEAPRPLMEGFYNGLLPTPKPVENSSRPILTHTPSGSSGTERFSESDHGSPNKPTSQSAKPKVTPQSAKPKVTPQPAKPKVTPLALKKVSTPETTPRSCVLRFDLSDSSNSNNSQNLTNTFKNLTLQSNGVRVAQTSNFKVPLHVQDNLFKIVKNHPNGLDCSMVPSLYRKMYKEELDYCKYGYRNLIQLIKDFPETYNCIRPDCGDYKVFDKSLPLPADLDSCSETVEKQSGRGNQNKSTMFPDSALPASMYLPSAIEYPPDVVKLKEIIPRTFISESTKEFDEIELHVGEVYDPSKFWIILKDDYNDLEELMGEMQMHYSFHYDKLKIDEKYLESGMFCVAIYGTQYHRALLTKVSLGDHKANIFYIDYGTVATVDSGNLYFLINKFAYLPRQAIRARLAGIIPPVAQSPWSVDTAMKFLSLVQCRSLVGRIYHIDREEQVLDVVLIDASRDKHFVINDALVRAKLAIYADQVPKRRLFSLYVPSVDPIYHFPTFHELENFLVPSLPELRAKTKLNVSHDEIYPEYYMVQVQYPEESDSTQSISGPVKRRQHLQEIYINSNNEIELTETPAVQPKVIKPPPGFGVLPQMPVAERVKNNVISELKQLFSTINDNPEVHLATSNVHELCNNTVPSLPVLTHEKNTQNSNTSTINRQEISQAMSSVLKEGNVVIIYLLDHLLKEYLVSTDISKNLVKYLKKQYVTLACNVLEEMMNDVLEHFDDVQLLKVCNSIKTSVPEFQFPLSRIKKSSSSSSESCFPSSTSSRSSTPNLDTLSPYAMPFVPSLSITPALSQQLQSTPTLETLLTESLIRKREELNLSSLYNQDNTISEIFRLENSKPCSSKLNCDPLVAQTLFKSLTPTCEEPKSSSFHNYDSTVCEESLMYNSKPCSTQPNNRFIFKKKLHGNVVHLINLNELIYITISEIQEVAKLKDTNVETIQKNICMCDGGQYLHDVNLTEHAELKEELQRFGLEYDDEILSLIRIEFIPEFFKLFASIMFPNSSFKRFLQEAYFESDDSSGYL